MKGDQALAVEIFDGTRSTILTLTNQDITYLTGLISFKAFEYLNSFGSDCPIAYDTAFDLEKLINKQDRSCR